jgi:hypothetical protein
MEDSKWQGRGSQEAAPPLDEIHSNWTVCGLDAGEARSQHHHRFHRIEQSVTFFELAVWC